MYECVYPYERVCICERAVHFSLWTRVCMTVCDSSASLQALSPPPSHSSSGLGEGSRRDLGSWSSETEPGQPLGQGRPFWPVGPQPAPSPARKSLLGVLPWARPGEGLWPTCAVFFARCQERPLCLLLLPVSSAPASEPRPSWGAPAPTPAWPGVSPSSTATLSLNFPPLLCLSSLRRPPAWRLQGLALWSESQVQTWLFSSIRMGPKSFPLCLVWHLSQGAGPPVAPPRPLCPFFLASSGSPPPPCEWIKSSPSMVFTISDDFYITPNQHWSICCAPTGYQYSHLKYKEDTGIILVLKKL